MHEYSHTLSDKMFPIFSQGSAIYALESPESVSDLRYNVSILSAIPRCTEYACDHDIATCL